MPPLEWPWSCLGGSGPWALVTPVHRPVGPTGQGPESLTPWQMELLQFEGRAQFGRRDRPAAPARFSADSALPCGGNRGLQRGVANPRLPSVSPAPRAPERGGREEATPPCLRISRPGVGLRRPSREAVQPAPTPRPHAHSHSPAAALQAGRRASRVLRPGSPAGPAAAASGTR